MRAALGRSVSTSSGIGRGRCTTRCLLTEGSDRAASSRPPIVSTGARSAAAGAAARSRVPARPAATHRICRRGRAFVTCLTPCHAGGGSSRPLVMTDQIDVIVLGGGYAGVLAANRLTSRAGVAVTLVNPRPRFVERIRLHQLVAGSDDAVVDFGDVVAPGVRLVVDSASRIDAAERRVELASGAALDYDYLVYAVGSGSAESRPPGAVEHAYPIAALEEAQRLRPALAATPPTAPVTVVGAGPTGIET